MEATLNLLIGGMLAENIILARFIGTEQTLRVVKKPLSALIFSLITVLFTLISSMISCLIYGYVIEPAGLTAASTFIFVVISALLVFGADRLVSILPENFRSVREYLPAAGLNCFVLAVMLETAGRYTLAETAEYSLIIGLAFVLTTMLFVGVMKRVELSACPKCFRGIPIAAVAAGLMAMAFSGFAGAVVEIINLTAVG